MVGAKGVDMVPETDPRSARGGRHGAVDLILVPLQGVAPVPEDLFGVAGGMATPRARPDRGPRPGVDPTTGTSRRSTAGGHPLRVLQEVEGGRGVVCPMGLAG